MAGVVDQQIVLLGQLRTQSRQGRNDFATGCVGEILDLEPVAVDQHVAHRFGIGHRHPQIGQVLVIVVADDQGVIVAEIVGLAARRGAPDEHAVLGPFTMRRLGDQQQPAAADGHFAANLKRAIGADPNGRAIDRQTRVRTHYSHQMTAAARAIAAMKFLMLRSKRVAIRRQSLRRQNMRSMMLRCL